ncbi:MAG TPA: hypothetical protein VGC45_09160 [Gryllotalpicola sp.]
MAQRSHLNAILISAVAAFLGLAAAPGLVTASAHAEAAIAPSASVAPHAGYCLTYDKMLADDKAADAQPGVIYSVLGADGGFSESSSTPGPEYSRLRDEKYAEWAQEKAAKIAGGASCIGYWEPASTQSSAN